MAVASPLVPRASFLGAFSAPLSRCWPACCCWACSCCRSRRAARRATGGGLAAAAPGPRWPGWWARRRSPCWGSSWCCAGETVAAGRPRTERPRGSRTPTCCRRPAERRRPRPSARLPERLGPYLLIDRIGEGGLAEVFTAAWHGARRHHPPLRGQAAAPRAVRRRHGGRPLPGRAGAGRLPAPSQHRRRRRLRGGRRAALPRRGVHRRAGRRPAHPPHGASSSSARSAPPPSCTWPTRCWARWNTPTPRSTTRASPSTWSTATSPPDNILISERGEVKLLDFGIAQVRGSSGLGTSGNETVKGNVDFMSPEQARGFTVDQRADLFSVGLVIYLLRGPGPPLPGQDAVRPAAGGGGRAPGARARLHRRAAPAAAGAAARAAGHRPGRAVSVRAPGPRGDRPLLRGGPAELAEAVRACSARSCCASGPASSWCWAPPAAAGPAPPQDAFARVGAGASLLDEDVHGGPQLGAGGEHRVDHVALEGADRLPSRGCFSSSRT